MDSPSHQQSIGSTAASSPIRSIDKLLHDDGSVQQDVVVSSVGEVFFEGMQKRNACCGSGTFKGKDMIGSYLALLTNELMEEDCSPCWQAESAVEAAEISDRRTATGGAFASGGCCCAQPARPDCEAFTELRRNDSGAAGAGDIPICCNGLQDNLECAMAAGGLLPDDLSFDSFDCEPEQLGQTGVAAKDACEADLQSQDVTGQTWDCTAIDPSALHASDSQSGWSSVMLPTWSTSANNKAGSQQSSTCTGEEVSSFNSATLEAVIANCLRSSRSYEFCSPGMVLPLAFHPSTSSLCGVTMTSTGQQLVVQ
eukprot:scaffold80298_cov45-Prasinocladus_malaysianus.AAC.1